MEIDKHNKNIWMFWDKPGQFRDSLSEMCYNSWVKNYPDYSVNIVDRETIKELIDPDMLNPLIKNIHSAGYSKPMAATSDLIRVLLLHKFGGIYVDVDVLSIRRAPEYLLENDFANVYKGKTFKRFHTPDTTTCEQFLSHLNIPQVWFLKANTDTYIINKFKQGMVDFCGTKYKHNRRQHNYRDGAGGYFFCGTMLKVLCREDDMFCTELKKSTLTNNPGHLQSKKWLFFRNKEKRKYTSLTDQERQYIESGKLHHTLKLSTCGCPGGFSKSMKDKYFKEQVFAPDTIISKIKEIYIK